jgi:hypothetical protein
LILTIVVVDWASAVGLIRPPDFVLTAFINVVDVATVNTNKQVNPTTHKKVSQTGDEYFQFEQKTKSQKSTKSLGCHKIRDYKW